ncbi:hypothetical protein CRUP_031661 [Coryphaenoides rupestris]|nr:hypothetical protein CRUP_031661 [Coryphaenoides rupestris]
MASERESAGHGDQTPPSPQQQQQRSCDPDGDGGAEASGDVMSVQSRYLRCPSPSNIRAESVPESMLETAEQLMVEDLYNRVRDMIDDRSPYNTPCVLDLQRAMVQDRLDIRAESVPESMLETAEQLMVEDLYNRVRDMIDDRSPYNTPCVLDLQRAMVQDRLESVAVNKSRLKRMGVTHIVNAAHGTGVYTSSAFYAGMDLRYMGIEVLVVSTMGVSRSAVLVAAYLMIFQHMSILEALTAVRKKRAVNPNEGFLKQLRELNEALMEERDDDDDTLSQCSVIDARARARIFGEAVVDDEDDEDTDREEGEEEERSMIGVKAHSIMMEEEEDAASVMSSVMSSVASSAAAALRNGPQNRGPPSGTQRTSDGQEELLLLPGKDGGIGGDGSGPGHEDDDEDGVGSMIREWQKRNERYQSDDWWEAQLNSDGVEEDSAARDDGDLESVALSEDVRAMKERLKHRPKRPPSNAASAASSSCSSYSDLWKQRLREIEEQAAARYRRKDVDESSESTGAAEVRGEANGGGGGAGGRKKIDDDMKSLLSDTGSMYNFCQRNKEKLSPLERWRVKRIQFGWNKKDGEDDTKSTVSGASGESEEVRTPALEDVNLTAYQTWKLKQQKRYGEENKDEIVEMSRGEDSAAVKRRQRREEILERSRKNLEESQSMCGWEAESCVSGGTVPLSAFWAGAGVTGPSVAPNDDTMSMLSGRSSVISSVSQSRGGARPTQSVHLSPGTPMVPPILPVPTVQGPGGEPMVNLASIQNWIANVVSETIMQKQSEMSLPPPSRAGSVLSYGGAPSVLSARGTDDDKVSLLLARGSAAYAPTTTSSRAESILSAGGAASSASGRLTGLGSVAGRGSEVGSSLASKRNKITTTSVPLYSLFQDQVDLKKLDSMEKEMKSDMLSKMATYEKKKILEDNKRSTLYKKKKPEEDEEEKEERKTREEEFLAEQKKKEKPARSYGLSGCLNLNPAMEKDKNTSVDDWLKSVRPPPRKASDEPAEVNPYDDLDASASEFGFSSREEEEEEAGYTSRYRSRLGGRGFDAAASGDGSPERFHHRDTDRAESPSNGFPVSGGYGRSTGRAYADEATDYGYSDSSSRYTHGSAATRCREVTDDGDDEVAAFIAQTRQRIKARAAAEVIDDEVLEAWRAQQESKSSSQSEF